MRKALIAEFTGTFGLVFAGTGAVIFNEMTGSITHVGIAIVFGLVVAAFGDNYNDVEMLQWTGLGVAMGNAPDAVKAVARAVTTSGEEDGVARFLAQIMLKAA